MEPLVGLGKAQLNFRHKQFRGSALDPLWGPGMAPAQQAVLGEEGRGNEAMFRRQAELSEMNFGPTMKRPAKLLYYYP